MYVILMLCLWPYLLAAAERALPANKCVLRRTTRHYDIDGNEIITVDYIRRFDDIKNYRLRVGIDEDGLSLALA